MRKSVRPGLVALVALGVASGARSQAQQATPKASAPAPAATKGAAPAAAAAPAPARPPIAGLNNPVATVNGEVITKGDLIDLFSKYPPPQGPPEAIYRDAVETLVNTRLIGQYLARLQIPVDEKKINEEIANLEKQLKSDGTSLATALLESNTTMADLKKELATRQRWVEFVKSKATDSTLKSFFNAHKDLFNGTQVRASHIMLRVDPKASAADKEKVRQKLLGIKQEIESGKMTFAQAANKYSEDPGNEGGAGGDLGYFGLNSGFVDEFATAAFAMRTKGQISDPVETIYGYHLIQMTDRKEGQNVDFEQQKPAIQQIFASDLQKDVLTAERARAKIDIKPMPADLFPPAPAEGNTPAPAPNTGTAAPK